MANAAEKKDLFDWLDSTIDDLPNKGQIILNFDGNTVEWETKAAHDGQDSHGRRERIEVRKFGRLRIRSHGRPLPTPTQWR